MNILIALQHSFELWNAPPWLAQKLQAAFPEHSVKHIEDYSQLGPAIESVEFLIAWSVRPEQFNRANNLRWIHSPAAAVHQLMFPELVNSNVQVTNARSVHGPVVAEHALGLIFALAKRLPQSFHLQQARRWGQQEIWQAQPTIRELRDSHLCVIGMGSIGRELTTRAKALGMRVTAVRDHPENGAEGADAVIGVEQIETVLPAADFVVLALPLTEATHHFIDSRALRHMRADAYLINVGRGPLIDDGALVEALREHRIAGAALDVFEKEPLPQDSPYWGLDNVLITPHTAAVSERMWERHFGLISENLRRYAAGSPLLGPVDKNKGY